MQLPPWKSTIEGSKYFLGPRVSTSRRNLYSLLLDTNAFDYIYDNKLTDKIRKAVGDGKVKLFATDVQKQELERFSNNTRKQELKQTAEKIQVTFMATSGAVVALDQEDVYGFLGSRVDWAETIDDRETQEKITHMGMQGPLKNRGDVLTLITAIKKNMDYLVTNDAGFEKSLNIFKKEKDTKLHIISPKGFERLLDG